MTSEIDHNDPKFLAYKLLGRDLTDAEMALAKKGLCVGCGTPVTEAGRLECFSCWKARVGDARKQKDFGAARASTHHEFTKRMGYKT